LQEAAVHLLQLREHLGAPASPTTEGIDVVPVVGRDVRDVVEVVRVEGGVERLHRLAHPSFGTRRLSAERGRREKSETCQSEDERFHVSSPATRHWTDQSRIWWVSNSQRKRA